VFIFYARKQPLLSARLSHRNSVCLSVRLSVTRVDQSKTVQDMIIKSSPSAAWKTFVSETVKLLHKFEGVTLNEGAKWERGKQNLRLGPISRCISVTVRDKAYRLLLITNRKSYTGSRLAPNSMTLNDLERQNRGFCEFFDDFGLQHQSISFTRWRHGTIIMRSR